MRGGKVHYLFVVVKSRSYEHQELTYIPRILTVKGSEEEERESTFRRNPFKPGKAEKKKKP